MKFPSLNFPSSALILATIILGWGGGFSYAGTITVDNLTDGLPTVDGGCTLREALINANTNSDQSGGDCAAGTAADVITLPAGTISFSTPDTYEASGATGANALINDLDILDDVTITGAGKGVTILDGGDLSGVFQFPLGGVSATIQDLTIANAGHDLSGNTNFYETAILINSGGAAVTLSLERIEILNGSSTYAQGMIEISGGAEIDLSIVDSEFVNNGVTPIYASSWSGSLLLDSSTVRGNSQPVWISSSGNSEAKTVTIANSTFSGALGQSSSTSALYVQGWDTANPMAVGIYNSTFNDNDTNQSYGYSIYFYGSSSGASTLEMANTIIANSNRRYGDSGYGACYVYEPASSFTDLGNNLVDDGSCITAGSSLTGDPLLTVLSDFGGGTLTHGLLAGSPALDAGDNSSCNAMPVYGLDQRGSVRPEGGTCDIGAFEGTVTNPAPVTPATIAVTNLSDTANAGDALCTFREALINANTNSDQSGGDCAAGTAADVITLPAGTISFSTPDTYEASGATGANALINDLDILDDVTITGAGKGVTILDGGDLSGVFQFPLGGVSATIQDLTIANAGHDLSGNTNFYETAILINSGGAAVTLSLERIEILNGSSTYAQGMIEISGGAEIDLSIVDSEFVNNGVTPIYASSWSGSLLLDSSTVRGNSQPVWISSSGNSEAKTVTIANSTFSGALGQSSSTSALYVQGWDTANPMAVGIYNSTFNDNDTNQSYGYSIYFYGSSSGASTLEMANTIIANSNRRYGDSGYGACYVYEPASSFTDLGNNLVDDGSCITAGSSLTGDPLLATLANNGGGTLTHAPLAGSMAINAGNNTECALHPVNNKDQRDLNRPNDSYCDIGAVEYNIAPISVDDSTTVIFGLSVDIPLVANDSDADGTLDLSSIKVTEPAHGSVTVDLSTGIATYLHTDSNTDVDQFSYFLKDDAGSDSNIASVVIDINVPPVAVDDAATVLAPASLVIDVLENDNDPDGSLVPASVIVVSGPLAGQVTVNPLSGEISYAHDGSNSNADSFTYTVADNNGTVSNEATVSLTIEFPDTTDPVATIAVPSLNQVVAPGTQLSGTANDEVGGSGIQAVQVAIYDLTNGQWVDENGSPSSSGGWITQYAVVSGSGENESWTYDLGSSIPVGNSYRFYAVAVDNEGNSKPFNYLEAVVFSVGTSGAAN